MGFLKWFYRGRQLYAQYYARAVPAAQTGSEPEGERRHPKTQNSQ